MRLGKKKMGLRIADPDLSIEGNQGVWSTSNNFGAHINEALWNSETTGWLGHWVDPVLHFLYSYHLGFLKINIQFSISLQGKCVVYLERL